MKSVHLLACAGVSLLALAVPAHAQDEAPKQDAGAENGQEIIVTARRREESVQDVPQVVNAVTSDTIEKLNIRKFEDIAAVVPGLELRANANGIGSVTTIRGVNFDVNQSGTNGTVQFYFNEAPLSSNVLLQTMYDVGQISVERGPQGTLRGRATPSGAINVIMRRPNMSEVGAYAMGTITSLDGYNANGAINVPVIADKLAIRVAGTISDDKGNRVRPVSGAYQLDNLAHSGRVSIRATPFDDVLQVQYTFQTTDRAASFFGGVESLNQFGPTSGATASPVTIRAEDRLAPAGIASRNQQNFKIYNWNADLNLFGQKLSYVRLRLKQHLVSLAPSDAAGVFGVNQTAPAIIFGSAVSLGDRPFGQPTDTRSEDLSQELRLQNNERVLGFLDYVIGGLKYEGGSNTSFDQVISARAAPAAPAMPTTLTRIDFLPLQRYAAFKEESIFGNLTAHIGDSTEISGGARHIWYQVNSGVRAFNVAANAYVENPTVRVQGSSEATIYAASIKHNFTRDLMVYGAFGTSWRPNTVVIGGPAIPTAQQVLFLSTAPETSKNFEIGAKSSWLDGRLTLNVTGYLQKYKNYPYRTSGTFYYNQQTGQLAQTSFVAGADVEVKGVEAEFAFRPMENWTIGGILSYADGRLKNAAVPCLDMNDDNVPDSALTPPTAAAYLAANPGGLDTCVSNIRANNAPPWSGTLQSEYTLPVSNKVDGFARGLFAWKGNSQNDPGNALDDVKSYGILNLYAGVRDPDGGWEVTLYAKNVTDSFRVLSRSNGPLTTTTGTHGRLTFTNYYGVTVTDPREFGITARIAIGSR